MIGLIQRVTSATVEVDKKIIGSIDKGILLLLGVEREDTEKQAQQLLHKVINYRIFEDDKNRMNLSLLDVVGELLIVPQFTLPADTKKGMRPSFTPAAPPETGKHFYDYFIKLANEKLDGVETGQFGADMKVGLINNGPVTFWLRV